MAGPPASDSGFLDDHLPHLLTLAARAASDAFERELRARGISVPVWRVLAVLLDRSGEKVTSLARRCLLQQPTMTKLLDRMEKDQLVRRSSSDRDQRIVQVSLTAQGRTLAVALVDAAKHHEAALLARHPQAATIKDGLRAIIAEHGS
jgi:DNA-binding MarR family transcriptional regulator